MRFVYISLFLFLTGISFQSCKDKKTPATSKQDSTSITRIIVPDTAIYGKLGEGTGMSCIEIITDKGDSITLNKVDENSGDAGIILGGTEHYGDALTITTNHSRESIVTLVNLNTLSAEWQTDTKSIFLNLQEDQKAETNWTDKPYTKWMMCNAQLILSNSAEISDTFCIEALNNDSLILNNKTNIFKFNRK